MLWYTTIWFDTCNSGGTTRLTLLDLSNAGRDAGMLISQRVCGVQSWKHWREGRQSTFCCAFLDANPRTLFGHYIYTHIHISLSLYIYIYIYTHCPAQLRVPVPHPEAKLTFRGNHLSNTTCIQPASARPVSPDAWDRRLGSGGTTCLTLLVWRRLSSKVANSVVKSISRVSQIWYNVIWHDMMYNYMIRHM